MVFERMAGPKFLRGKTISLLFFFATYLNHFLCDCLVVVNENNREQISRLMRTDPNSDEL